MQNEAKIKNPIIRVVREQLEQRAEWLYLLSDEAEKQGLALERYAPAAVRRCGLFHGAQLVGKSKSNSLRELRRIMFPAPARWIFEMKLLRCDDDHLDLDFHYCPLVKAWQKQGCSDAKISELCDVAMCGDAAIAESYGCKLELPKAIAHGDDCCALRFKREPGAAGEQQKD
jgi:hypothetical protein